MEKSLSRRKETIGMEDEDEDEVEQGVKGGSQR